MSTVIDFPSLYTPAETKQTAHSHYCMTEDHEFSLYETKNALKGIIHLVDSIKPGNTLQINPEEISALLSLLEARLPNSNEMEFISR